MTESGSHNNPPQLRRSSPVHHGALSEIFREVQERLPEFFNRFFDAVDELLFDRADNAGNLNEQRIHFDAMRLLRSQRDLVTDKALLSYYQLFEALLKNDLSLQLVKPEFEKSDLQLLENEALEEMIALDNIVSAAVGACGEELDFLTKRLVYLQGQSISSEDNPFIPEALCEALAAQIRAIKMDEGPRHVLFHLLHQQLEKFWPSLVSSCNSRLMEAGVLPDLEKQKRRIVKKDESAATEETQAEDSPEAPEPESRIGEERAGYGALPANSRLSEELIDLCRSMRAVFGDLAERPPAAGGNLQAGKVMQSLAASPRQFTAPAFLDQLKEEGLETAFSRLLEENKLDINNLVPEEQGLIRVLDQAFRKINDRPHVPADLSSLILQLQLPITAMALEDGQFLSKDQHPGRRLVNEIFKVSATFLDGAESKSDPLRDEVDKLVEKLQSLQLDSRELARMLADFIDFVEKDKKRLYMREQRLLEEEEALARVSITHGRVYDLFMGQLQGRTVPVFFRKFCEDAWSKVVFLELLRSEEQQVDWKQRLEELKVMTALVGGNRQDGEKRWEGVKPGILRRLEEINLEPAAISRWITLFDQYCSGDKGANQSRKNAFDPVTVEDLTLSLPGVVYINSPEEEVDLRALESVDSLRQGVWVEFRATEESEAVRCRLAGVVKPLSKYVFTNRRGKKVVEETRSRLARKLKSGDVNLVDNSRLFDSAFEDVVSDIQAQADQQKGPGRLH